MTGKYKKWTCALCGDEIIEGQRFTLLPGRGYAHIECIHELVAEKYRQGVPQDLLALLDVEELLSYAIIRLKQAERTATPRLREWITRIRNTIEDYSAEAGEKLGGYLD